MRAAAISAFLGAAGLLAAVPASAHSPYGEPAGSLVSVSVEVDGRDVPLYPAPDGSGRFYLEAREGARYAVRIANRTHERLGVVLTVDGLNAISGGLEPRRGPHVRAQPLGLRVDQGLAHVPRGCPPVHVRGRAGLVRRPVGQGELEDGMDRGDRVPRAAPAWVYQPGPVYRTDPYEESGARDRADERSADAGEAQSPPRRIAAGQRPAARCGDRLRPGPRRRP
jgi:hypothetical protein